MINDYLYNLSESVIITSLFCMIYLAVFQQETSFKQNRLFLLTGILLSLVLPFMNFSYPQNLQNIATIQLDSIKIIPDIVNKQQTNSYNAIDILFAVYVTISTVFLIRTIFQIIKISSFYNKSKINVSNSLKIVYTGKKHSSFSFLNFIFIDKETEISDNLNIVIRHETAHIKQLHSLDLLLFELLLIIQWFNPLLWIYGKKIKENHEFLADRSLINKGLSISKYQQVLLSNYSCFKYDLINNFNSLTFKRLIMMTKSNSKRKSIVKLMAILPIMIISVYLVSCSDKQEASGLEDKQMVVDKGKVTIISKDEKYFDAKKSEDKLNGRDIYLTVDEMPVFEGGDLGLRTYIANNVEYPDEAKDKQIEGKVYIRFVVDHEGNVAETKVLKGVAPSLDNEALRVIKSLPKWKAGKVKGVAVPVYFTVPINFKLH